MSQIPREFLSRCFVPQESLALLLRRENPPTVLQRVVSRERVLETRYQAWLSHQNTAGADIYFAANPLRRGSRKRTKESIASVRHLYIDIDADGDARLAALRATQIVPTPTAILSTSPGKYQVLWRVRGFDFEGQEPTLKLLAVAFGGDPACTDCNRVLRIPGFVNHKYHPPHLVTVEYPDDSTWTPDDFRLNRKALESLSCPRAPARGKPRTKHSNSESDWAWVCNELSCGKDATKLTEELASRRSDKPNPLYYAQRTVDVASARFWLIQGVGIDEVVGRLDRRRRLEIPAQLCALRAREIAATAERMLAR
jgi:hypothetical protein